MFAIPRINELLAAGCEPQEVGRASYKPDLPETHYLVLDCPDGARMHVELVTQEDLDFANMLVREVGQGR